MRKVVLEGGTNDGRKLTVLHGSSLVLPLRKSDTVDWHGDTPSLQDKFETYVRPAIDYRPGSVEVWKLKP